MSVAFSVTIVAVGTAAGASPDRNRRRRDAVWVNGVDRDTDYSATTAGARIAAGYSIDSVVGPPVYTLELPRALLNFMKRALP